jgi:hypothetical protein
MNLQGSNNLEGYNTLKNHNFSHKKGCGKSHPFFYTYSIYYGALKILVLSLHAALTSLIR